jgi:hypothetical protein
VDWDVDNVWYKGISTTHCAEKSPLNPEPFIDSFIEKGWFTREDVEKWSAEYNSGNPIVSIGNLAMCLTDFLYKIRKGESSLITKEQTIEGKQSLLRGLTIKDIKRIAESTKYNEGLEETVSRFKKDGVYQAALSDGLGPFVMYHMNKLGMDHKGFVPAVMEIGGKELPFEEYMLDMEEDAKLTGKVLKFDKGKAFFDHANEKGYPLSVVAAIDDSGANVEKILLKIQEGGGIAIGYNPSEEHRKTFQKYSVPILKGNDLRLFGEIVRDPKKLGQYCF